jgi:hypothetical protein
MLGLEKISNRTEPIIKHVKTLDGFEVFSECDRHMPTAASRL